MVSVPLFLNWLFTLAPWAGWAIIGKADHASLGGAIALLVGKRKFDKFNPLPDNDSQRLRGEHLVEIANHRN